MSNETLSEIGEEIGPFGLDHSHYVNALQRLLALDTEVKAGSPAKYLDTVFEILLRLIETYQQPILDPGTSHAVRAEAETWAGAEEPASRTIARDILNELPPG